MYIIVLVSCIQHNDLCLYSLLITAVSVVNIHHHIWLHFFLRVGWAGFGPPIKRVTE